MDRKPEHLQEDSLLRPEFVGQQSWDEWALENAPFFLVPNAQELVEGQMRAMGMDATYEDALYVAMEEWQATLSPETRLMENLYLRGLSYTERRVFLDQQHAFVRDRAIEMGLVEERPKDVEFREQFGD